MSLVSVVCCQGEVSAKGRSLVRGRPPECGVSDLETSTVRRPWPTTGCRATEKIQDDDCGVSEYDHEVSLMRRPWPTTGCRAMKKKKLLVWNLLWILCDDSCESSIELKCVCWKCTIRMMRGTSWWVCVCEFVSVVCLRVSEYLWVRELRLWVRECMWFGECISLSFLVCVCELVSVFVWGDECMCNEHQNPSVFWSTKSNFSVFFNSL